MFNVSLDVLCMILWYLTPNEREMLKTTCHMFHEAYIIYLRQIVPKKHILYSITRRKNTFTKILEIYEIESIDDNMHALINWRRNMTNKSKESKTYTYKCGLMIKLKKNRYGVIYGERGGKHLYVYEKEYVKEAHAKKCDYCGFFDCYYFTCGILKKSCVLMSCKEISFKFEDTSGLTNIDFQKLYCEHVFCTRCMTNMSIRFHNNTAFNTVVKHLIIRE